MSRLPRERWSAVIFHDALERTERDALTDSYRNQYLTHF